MPKSSKSEFIPLQKQVEAQREILKAHFLRNDVSVAERIAGVIFAYNRDLKTTHNHWVQDPYEKALSDARVTCLVRCATSQLVSCCIPDPDIGSTHALFLGTPRKNNAWNIQEDSKGELRLVLNLEAGSSHIISHSQSWVDYKGYYESRGISQKPMNRKFELPELVLPTPWISSGADNFLNNLSHLPQILQPEEEGILKVAEHIASIDHDPSVTGRLMLGVAKLLRDK
jgi:hypothetical protein